MLGYAGSPYHLEFTHSEGVTPSPTEEDLLVFYLPDVGQWQRQVAQLEGLGVLAVEPLNPYWSVHGKTFVDPDGYRVVLQNSSWVTGSSS